MNSLFFPGCCGMTRRGFLLGAGAGVGLAAGASLGWLGARGFKAFHQEAAGAVGGKMPVAGSDGMPGPFPGRVVEVHHPGSVSADYTIDASAVKQMVDRGMCEMTGADHPTPAWQKLFQKGDVVAIKVNPVGRRYSPKQTQAISSHELVIECVRGLKRAGLPAQDIILYDRYGDQFRDAGYENLLGERALDGVRWYASAVDYDHRQVDIEGYDSKPRGDRHIVGYDPDVFVHMGYRGTQHDPKDDRAYRSHLSVVVSRMVNKFINLPVLKDHGSAGVTLALKNMSHGMFNNVARSHLDRVMHGEMPHGPNQCNTFIPTAAAHPLIRQKATLHILDGLIAVYQGGPAGRINWPYRSLFFATDPVAMDHVGWDIIDAKRVEKGLPPVARTGLQFDNPGKETLDRRQPEHIILAGTAGLGVFDSAGIKHQRIEMTNF